jgi:hypothetical protein
MLVEYEWQCQFCLNRWRSDSRKFVRCSNCKNENIKIIETTEIHEENKRTHDSGAIRSTDKDNVAYHLISPIALKVLAQVLKEGGQKYGEYNWENGFPVTDILNHAVGHIYDFLSGDNSEDHLGHAFCNLMFAIHSFKLWPDLNTDLRREGCLPADKFVKIKNKSKEI